LRHGAGVRRGIAGRHRGLILRGVPHLLGHRRGLRLLPRDQPGLERLPQLGRTHLH